MDANRGRTAVLLRDAGEHNDTPDDMQRMHGKGSRSAILHQYWAVMVMLVLAYAGYVIGMYFSEYCDGNLGIGRFTKSDRYVDGK